MRKGLLGSLLVLLSAAGWSFGQTPAPAGAGHGPDPMTVCVDDGRGAVWSGHGGDGSGTCLWGSAEYQLWRFKDQPLPPFFVLTGDPLTANPGALNAGGVPVSNHARLDYDTLSGARVTLGAWLGGDGGLGIEVSGFELPRQSKALAYTSDANGKPVYGFRYIDTPGSSPTPLAEDVFQASVPAGNPFGVGPFAGGVAIVAATRLWDAEVNAVLGGRGDGGSSLQFLAGFRHTDLTEAVALLLRSTAIDGGTVNFLGNTFPAPASIATLDAFATRNQFYGGQIGVRGERCMGGLVVGGTATIALGNMEEVVRVGGISRLVSDTGAVTSVPSGQFAGPSNIGRRTRNEFAYIPEFEIKVGYQITSCLRATIGYDFLYISRVARPGNQIDLLVNDSTNPVNGAFGKAPIDTSAFPRPLFNQTDFWAQGLTFGLELRF